MERAQAPQPLQLPEPRMPHSARLEEYEVVEKRHCFDELEPEGLSQ